MTRKDFVAELEADACGATLRLDSPSRKWPAVTVARRHPRILYLMLPSGRGVSFHRNGGISLPGVPSSGGTTICWGAVRRRIEEHGRDHRAIRLGPIAIFVGRDF